KSSAELPARRRRVWLGPPLSASGPSLGPVFAPGQPVALKEMFRRPSVIVPEQPVREKIEWPTVVPPPPADRPGPVPALPWDPEVNVPKGGPIEVAPPPRPLAPTDPAV